MSHQLFPDQENENVSMGRIIGESTYARDKKEIDLGNAKIDLIRSENGNLIVGEVKKSSRFIQSASKQLLFYLLQLREMGIDAKGQLMIPEEKKKIEVVLDETGEAEIRSTIKEITALVNRETAPEPVKNKYCRKCAYNEFCWA